MDGCYRHGCHAIGVDWTSRATGCEMLPRLVPPSAPPAKKIKRCKSCNRKQYVASARCICGWIEEAVSPEDVALKREYEEMRRRKLLNCVKARR